jgi:cell surface protein SprA
MNARLLSPQEYTYNDQLGFISINLNVQPDQVVGVAMNTPTTAFRIKSVNFQERYTQEKLGRHQKTNVLFVKMLKSTTANVRFPIWDLMMKNVYAVGTANVDPQEFRFDIFYEDPGKGQKRFLERLRRFLPAFEKAVRLLAGFPARYLNLQGDPGPDGIFDFVPGLTINLRSGRVMFPVLEPFGSYLYQ